MRRIDTPEQAEEQIRRLQLATADDMRREAELWDDFDWARAVGLRRSAAELERRAGRARLRAVAAPSGTVRDNMMRTGDDH